jgi:hypothetical protein
MFTAITIYYSGSYLRSTYFTPGNLLHNIEYKVYTTTTVGTIPQLSSYKKRFLPLFGLLTPIISEKQHVFGGCVQ